MTGQELKTLLDEHGGKLSRFCYSLCKNEHDADDLFQDTCVRLLSSKTALDPGEGALRYAYKTCLNAYRSVYNARRRRAEREFAVDRDEYFANIAAPAGEKSEYNALYSALDSLPFKYRTVIVLSYFRELTNDETAAILGVPPGTVKSRLHKAKQLLKKELQK